LGRLGQGHGRLHFEWRGLGVPGSSSPSTLVILLINVLSFRDVEGLDKGMVGSTLSGEDWVYRFHSLFLLSPNAWTRAWSAPP
jgi:hypothetical protein